MKTRRCLTLSPDTIIFDKNDDMRIRADLIVRTLIDYGIDYVDN